MMTANKNSLFEHLQLDQVLNTVPSGLFLVDLDMRVLYWNKTAETITGYTAEEAVGQHCSFLQGIPCNKSCQLYNDNTPKPVIGGRCAIVTKFGENRLLLKNIEYLRDAKGNVIGGIESFNDITNQHQLEQSLREQAANLEARVAERTQKLAHSENRFRSVLDTMDDFAYITTADYRIIFTNQAMTKRFGDISGQLCHKALHDFDEICPWCPFPRIDENQTVREERQLGADGRTYEIIHSPLIGDDGRLQKLSVCRDITERKQSETDLREANRELDAFAHSVSHDLRGILAPVVTSMDFVRSQYKQVLDPQVLQILEEVERQSERAIALLDDLLDLAQVGHIEDDGQLTDVDAVVHEIINELARQAGVQRHQIKATELPQIWVPDTLVYQIFANLISNACNYVKPESGPIEIGCRAEPHQYIYFVRDHGPGVDTTERNTIFDIFYRGDASKGTRGTGLGLAIVRKIALRCQGSAWVEETPGGGATFCVSFPKQSIPSPAATSRT